MTGSSGRRDMEAGDFAPIVSVVIPVWNVAAYLRACLDSVVNQTIGFENVEIVAVDDGSTDESGAILDEYAARHSNVVVLHEPNSGGPGRPRNLGLDRARGRYVFFLDADDYLGPEALQRTVSLAEKAASDIVLCRIVSVAGRTVRRESGIDDRRIERATLQQVYHSGNVHKLFRTSFLRGAGVRFTETVAGGEDGDLMAGLYHRARAVSVDGEYDAYFLRRRPGSQTARHDSPEAMIEYLRRIEERRIRVLASAEAPGPGRDALMRRHFRKLARMFAAVWLAYPAEDRRRAFEVGSEIVRRWHTELIERSLPAWAQIRIHCLRHGRLAELADVGGTRPETAFGEPLVAGRRLFARYPHFRDGSGIPDRCFDITDEVRPTVRLARAELQAGRLRLAGEAYLALVGGTTTIELRRWPGGATWAFPARSLPSPLLRDVARPYPDAGFEVEIDLATAAGGVSLAAGIWLILASIGSTTVRRRTPIEVRASAETAVVKSTEERTGDASLLVGPGRDLRLRVGPRRPLREGLARIAARLGRTPRVLRRAARALRRIARR
ncbi:MAG: glycosyltransferase family 2 protein [Chloroflexi bacterium]|nr:glycosyltransferase family 2 protein [Chloroflexota bacterium]